MATIPSFQVFHRANVLSRRLWSSILRPPSHFKRITPYSFCYSTPGEPWSLQIASRRPVLGISRSFTTTSRLQSQHPKTSSGPFTYAISASYSSKHDQLNLSANLYTYDPYRRLTTTITESHWSERKFLRPRSGQDAFFVSAVGPPAAPSNIASNGSQQIAFGVVDGVGGWEDVGVDPADFSHALCDYMASASTHYPDSFGGSANAPHPLRPTPLLELAHQSVQQDHRIRAGGSTACVAVASTTGFLDVANLGDSGYAHLSPFRLNFVSLPQTHAFNTPFQLSKLPRKLAAQTALFGGQHYAEQPGDAQVSRRELRHGDVLVFATDGVWDNLSPEDVLRVTCRVMVGMGGWVVRPADGAVDVAAGFAALAMGGGASTSMLEAGGEEEEEFDAGSGGKIAGLSAVLASTITREAKEASLNQNRDGPFAREVQRLYPLENWSGGKPDDICTLVVVAVQEGL